MLSAADNATRTLQSKFKQTGEAIRRDLGQPFTIQAEFNLDGDPKRKYDEIVGSQKRILAEQKKINDKARTKQKLQDKISQALKGTIAEKKEALKLVERLMRTTGKTKDEMKALAAAAKELKGSLPKDADMPTGEGMDRIDKSLTGANIAANLATKAISALGNAMSQVIQTGVRMESLNLQMEAFAGGTREAEIAMTRFKEVAAQTPLDVMGVAEAGKIMMAYGVGTGEAVEATERLAIAAAATGGDINLLARNLGQVQAQGRAYTRDLTQFAIQGIPIWDELAKVTGKSVDELKSMAKDGNIGMEQVMQALRNMTKEGSAFAEVAARMQETYAGKLALLESDFQMASGQIVDNINRIDTALGGISDMWIENIMGSMDQFANTMDNTATVLEQLRYYMNVEFADAGVDLGQVFDQMGAKLRENLIQLIPGIGPALNGASQAVNHFGQNTTGEFSGIQQIARDMNMSVETLGTKLSALALIPGNEQLVASFRSQAAEVGNLTTQLEEQIQANMDLNGITKTRIQEEIDEYTRLRDEANAALTSIAGDYDAMKEKAVAAYNEIESRVNDNIANSNLIIENLREQNRALQELGPAGERLAEIRRQELEYTAKTGQELKGHVTDEEMKKLRAKATLEQMDAQKQSQENQKLILQQQKRIEDEKKKLREEEKRMQEKVLQIEKDKKVALDEQKASIGNLQNSIDGLVDVLNGNLAPNWESIDGLIKNADSSTEGVKQETDRYNNSINGTIAKLNSVNMRLDEMKKRILSMPKLPSASGGSGGENRFAGGPVSGGSTYTVNELGKEAFLSASGRLSMINAPSWGEWTAPGSGTVIPAHLTKKLNVPTGGVNLNKTAGAGAGVSGAMRVISAAGGDTFHQNVTVQAVNPVQAANNMMVEMTRLKRRRMGR